MYYTILTISLVLTIFEKRPKKYDFIQQTVFHLGGTDGLGTILGCTVEVNQPVLQSKPGSQSE